MNARNKYSGLAAIIIAVGSLVVGNNALHAWATIGSNGLPARAALLDLKTRDAINPPKANDTLNISSLTGDCYCPGLNSLIGRRSNLLFLRHGRQHCPGIAHQRRAQLSVYYP